MYIMFLANGFEETEALCPLDLMRRAGIDVKTVGIGGKVITGSHGIAVTADIGGAELDPEIIACDGVILPGGMPGTKNLDASPLVDRMLRKAYTENKLIAAICAAPSVPGIRGMYNGRRAICFPGFEEKLEGAIIDTGARVETDGNLITGVGMGAAYEFGLAIVKSIKGADAEKKLAASALIPPELWQS